MLTDQKCRSVQPGEKPVKHFDAHGLHLLITPKGFKTWRMKYRFGGKEKQLTFGPYPEVSLRQARDKCEMARRQLREGIDPGEEYRRAKARRISGISDEKAFRSVAMAWHQKQSHGWKPKHAADVLHSLETEIFPRLGHMSVDEIRPDDVRDILLAVQARGATETAHRLRGRISLIFRLAIASGLATFDPAASVSAVLRPIVKRMQPALLKLADARAFLRKMEEEPAHPTTKLASRLLALTAARPGMIRWAQIEEFEGLDTAEPIWRIPAEKMKLERAQSEQAAFEFIIPLAPQAVELVRVAAAFAGSREYLFPSARHSHRPISENALNANYRRVPGFAGRHVPHGWRASFSTIMNERAIDFDRPADRAIIDLMLAHQPSGVEAHYNRAAYMKRRREIAQEWAALLLDGFSPPQSLIEGPRRTG